MAMTEQMQGYGSWLLSLQITGLGINICIKFGRLYELSRDYYDFAEVLGKTRMSYMAAL
ncbi:hypothetical protein AGMMS49936_10560 [Endomicrobiia bacterium]|nr:hypothetical protein AGMMS49936_10560 [Endomicrobiia bacterium]